MPPPDALAFTQLMLNVIDEGRRTATYKLAVLLALIDCCASESDAAGRAPRTISTRTLARHVVELYWPQVRPYAAAEGHVLRQATTPRAVTVDAVAELRQAVPSAATLDMAERLFPDATRNCLDNVELNLVRMPLGKLQRPALFNERVNADYPRFLYDDSPFHERVTARQLEQHPLSLELREGVGDYLVSLAGLLRPLVELHWTRDVARLNRMTLGEDGLREFLFGTTRTALTRLRPGLMDAQAGTCFYCQRSLRLGDIHVDHFVPWSRVPNDALTNLVLADGRCNESKRDNDADLDHVVRWASRPRDVLEQISYDAQWPLRLGESLSIARSRYRNLPDGSRLWSQPGGFSLLDRDRLPDVLPTLVP